MLNHQPSLSRRRFLAGATAVSVGAATGLAHEEKQKALVAITLDLEMSRHYPRRGMTEWDFQKGSLDTATKEYSVQAARLAEQHGGLIHFFCVGRVLEQPCVDWLKEIAAAGHPIGNHTYDHVNVLATKPDETQFRFRRSPWLIKGMTAAQVIKENIRMTSIGLKERAGIDEQGFRTPGGFTEGLADREDIQQMLLKLGFTWVSSKYPRHKSGSPKQAPTSEVYADIVRAQQEAQPFIYSSGLVEIPMSPISDVTAFRSHYWKLDYFLKAIHQAVEWAIETGSVFDFIAHPSCLVVEDPSFESIKLICELVTKAGDRAEIVALDSIAQRAKRLDLLVDGKLTN